MIVGIFAFTSSNKSSNSSKDFPTNGFAFLIGDNVNSDNISTLKVLNDVKMYNLENGELKAEENVANYPIMIDGNIKFIYSVENSSNQHGANLIDDTAPLLDLAKQSGAKEIS